MFEGVSERLDAGGTFCLYGPFNYQGRYTSDSNRDFDRYLRAQAGHMGLRDIDDVTALASGLGLELRRDASMPANNRFLVFTRIQ